MGGRGARGAGAVRRRRAADRVALVVLIALLAVPGTLHPAGAVAPASGSASVSDTTPVPGQVVTVQASGLLPGGTASVDYLPDAVRLATVTVDGGGGFRREVQIPPRTKDGPKQIVVTAVGDDGRYAYLPTDLQVLGPAASARLASTALRPGGSVAVEGSRFLVGADVRIVLFPEQVDLGTATADGEGRFRRDVRMPVDLLNGRHVIVVAGLAAGGSYAYLQLEATATGGSGRAGEAVVPPRLPSGPLGSTSSTAPSTTARGPVTGEAPRTPLSGPDDEESDAALVAVVALCVVVLAGLGVAWLASSAGRRWWRRQRRRFRHGRRHGRRPGRR